MVASSPSAIPRYRSSTNFPALMTSAACLNDPSAIAYSNASSRAAVSNPESAADCVSHIAGCGDSNTGGCAMGAGGEVLEPPPPPQAVHRSDSEKIKAGVFIKSLLRCGRFCASDGKPRSFDHVTFTGLLMHLCRRLRPLIVSFAVGRSLHHIDKNRVFRSLIACQLSSHVLSQPIFANGSGVGFL